MRAVLSLLAVVASASLAHADAAPPRVPVAVEIVIEGHEISMGNDDIEPETSEARYLGLLNALKKEIDAAPLATYLPSGSKVGLVTYSDHAVIRWPLRDVAMFSGATLGTQKDYYRLVGTNLLSGLEVGVTELASTNADKKFLVVIGDGNDTNPDTAKQAFAALAEDAARAGVEPVSIIYKNALSSPENLLVHFDPNPTTMANADGIPTAMRQRIAASMRKTPIVAHPTIVQQPSTCTDSWFMRWRWQFLIGSLLVLIAMNAVWLARRDRK